jgi:hypothetical protein
MFSFKRFFEQFKILLMQNTQRILLNIVIMSLILIYLDFRMFDQSLNINSLQGYSFNYDIWGFVIGFLTIVNSSGVFSALQHTNSGIHYYMTPATIGEKYISAWLYSSIFTIVIYSLTILVVQTASIGIGNAITGQNLSYGFPDSDFIRRGFLSIMFLQSLFFLGAVIFKKNSFGKTLLSIIVLSIIISFATAAIVAYIHQGTEAFAMSRMNSYNITINNMDDFNNLTSFKGSNDAWKAIVTGIPFICWIAAYFRLQTREV